MRAPAGGGGRRLATAKNPCGPRPSPRAGIALPARGDAQDWCLSCFSITLARRGATCRSHSPPPGPEAAAQPQKARRHPRRRRREGPGHASQGQRVMGGTRPCKPRATRDRPFCRRSGLALRVTLCPFCSWKAQWRSGAGRSNLGQRPPTRHPQPHLAPRWLLHTPLCHVCCVARFCRVLGETGRRRGWKTHECAPAKGLPGDARLLGLSQPCSVGLYDTSMYVRCTAR